VGGAVLSESGAALTDGAAAPNEPVATLTGSAAAWTESATARTESATASRGPSGSLGRLAFGFLAVSVLSGVALVPFYSPARPAESLEALQGGLPWGFVLRALHAYSSFGLLVVTAGHLAQVLIARTERQLTPSSWWRSVLLLPVTVAALLGGFALRGDAEAGAALAVWRGVVGTLPVLGSELARLLVGTIPNDLGAVTLHHAGTFTLLVWLLTSEHGKRLVPDSRSVVLAGLVSVALAGAIPLPLGSSSGTARVLLGPWYLLGLQGALVDLPAAVAWLAPLLFVVALGLVRHTGERWRRFLVALLGAWVVAYAGFTVRILLISRG